MWKNRKTVLLTFAMAFVLSFLGAQENQSLRVMTYNIWNGFDWGKDTDRKANAIQWIKSKKPDVLALQEMCGYDEQQLKKDAQQWGHPYVQLLKSEGYPTALTSNKPIVLKERALDSFWHGLLHCSTYGIDFFVIHLSPFDSGIRLDEARQITERIQNLKNNRYIILGDFNAFSPMDASWMEKKDALRRQYAENKNKEYSNLREGEFDYAVLSEFLAAPSIDVCLGKIDLKQGTSYPTKVFTNPNDKKSGASAKGRRIDFILSSPSLTKHCIKAQVYNQEETHLLSDHYPIMAEYQIAQ
ncbi:endonuclease/exonuclease/phosphatase family protein [Ulvibacterium sp.]|uniref:endonuclease/exonuclease/phosphatase family protein n=1 Tax=Ulvibacterium sp. TaxID=2665914 RepID=UPI003CC53A51